MSKSTFEFLLKKKKSNESSQTSDNLAKESIQKVVALKIMHFINSFSKDQEEFEKLVMKLKELKKPPI